MAIGVKCVPSHSKMRSGLLSVNGTPSRSPEREELDVILARELVNGQDTLLCCDDKGNPVWDWRPGK